MKVERNWQHRSTQCLLLTQTAISFLAQSRDEASEAVSTARTMADPSVTRLLVDLLTASCPKYHQHLHLQNALWHGSTSTVGWFKAHRPRRNFYVTVNSRPLLYDTWYLGCLHNVTTLLLRCPLKVGAGSCVKALPVNGFESQSHW